LKFEANEPKSIFDQVVEVAAAAILV